MIKTFLLKLLCTVTPLCDTILFTGGECMKKYIIVLIAMAILLLCLCIYGWIKQESDKKTGYDSPKRIGSMRGTRFFLIMEKKQRVLQNPLMKMSCIA